jgi:hypothetical protein
MQQPRSRLVPPPRAISGLRVHTSPTCIRCASSDTEPLAMMQRHTCDADDWVRCNECGHTFTAPRWPKF